MVLISFLGAALVTRNCEYALKNMGTSSVSIILYKKKGKKEKATK